MPPIDANDAIDVVEISSRVVVERAIIEVVFCTTQVSGIEAHTSAALTVYCLPAKEAHILGAEESYIVPFGVRSLIGAATNPRILKDL
jgi:hypothetical protein